MNMNQEGEERKGYYRQLFASSIDFPLESCIFLFPLLLVDKRT